MCELPNSATRLAALTATSNAQVAAVLPPTNAAHALRTTLCLIRAAAPALPTAFPVPALSLDARPAPLASIWHNPPPPAASAHLALHLHLLRSSAVPSRLLFAQFGLFLLQQRLPHLPQRLHLLPLPHITSLPRTCAPPAGSPTAPPATLMVPARSATQATLAATAMGFLRPNAMSAIKAAAISAPLPSPWELLGNANLWAFFVVQVAHFWAVISA